jgi:hypothetical protein
VVKGHRNAVDSLVPGTSAVSHSTRVFFCIHAVLVMLT